MNTYIESYNSVTPIFICGHYRSGTSLLNHLLDGHEQVNACLIETKFFTRFMPMVKAKKPLHEALEASFLRHHFKESKLQSKVFGPLDPEEFLGKYYTNVERFPPGDQRYFDAYMLTCMDMVSRHPEKVSISVEKTPLNELYWQRILELWPNAKFICVIRDPRDLHATIKSRSEFNLHVRTTIHNWRRSVNAIEQMKTLGDRVYHTTYEALVSNPAKHMQEIASFCGIDYSDSLLMPSSVGGKVNWSGNAQNTTYSGVSTESVGKWREKGDPSDMKLIEAALREEMQQLGYACELNPSFQTRIDAKIQNAIIIAKRIRQWFKGDPEGAY